MANGDADHSPFAIGVPIAPCQLSKCLKTLKMARASYWLKLARIWDRRHVGFGSAPFCEPMWMWRGPRLLRERLGERLLQSGVRGAVKGGRGVLVAERAIGVLAAGVEQHLELVARAVRRFANEGKLVGFCVDRDRDHLAGLAVEVLVEMHQPVGRRLHIFHQPFPGRAVKAQPQYVEQEGLLGRARGADEKEESDGGGEAHRKSWL